jgi:hypothetical protein
MSGLLRASLTTPSVQQNSQANYHRPGTPLQVAGQDPSVLLRFFVRSSGDTIQFEEEFHTDSAGYTRSNRSNLESYY